MSIFRFLFGIRSNGKDNENSVQVSNKENAMNVNRNVITKVETRELRDSAVEEQDAIDKLNVAAQLLSSGKFELSIEAYEKIALQYPKKAEDCESQIGAALYFLGRYDEAMSYYNKQLSHNGKHSPNSLSNSKEI